MMPMANDDDSNSDTNTLSSLATEDHTQFRLLDLPLELINEVLAFLSPVELAKICQTCRILNSHASAPRLWKEFLTESIPENKHHHAPYNSWKEMYGTHFPFWHLPKHKLWISDRISTANPLVGQLLLLRYDYRLGSIEGYRLVAELPESDGFFNWTHDARVFIHSFNPVVSLFLDDPVVKLDRGAFQSGKNRLQQEADLNHGEAQFTRGIRCKIFPAIPIPPHRQFPSMSLWPPSTIPATERVRNESPSMFEGSSHKPSTYDEMSTTTFRLRKWLVLGGISERLGFGGFRRPKDVITYSTISPEHYLPTEDKPYQGIWVGDYSGHGCEFLVIIQTLPDEDIERPPIIEIPPRAVVDEILPNIPAGLPPATTPNPRGCQGRLDAIKLTGDPNIPRGEPSWIAEDIGRAGLLRIASEPEFRGARVVKSSGHIASAGFRNDRYTPSQLIMISEDRLAQYWVEMGHISFFQRVNIDDYLKIS